MKNKQTFNIINAIKVSGLIAFVFIAFVSLQKLTTSAITDRSRASALRANHSIFADVPKNSYAFGAIERIYRLGITSGCSQNPLNFCPDKQITRGEAAVFIIRAIYGSTVQLTPAAQPIFGDVDANNPFRGYIEKMYTEHLTNGCSQNPLLFCPNDPLNRSAMAAFIVRALHGGSFVPPSASGTVFRDVPTHTLFAPYIEQLYKDGYASIRWSGSETNINCDGANLSFCPYKAATRADMAILMERIADKAPIFSDVPINYWAFSSIQRIGRENITSGCSQNPKKYCPDEPTTRAMAAVLMLRGKYGADYVPPASPEGPFFEDVPATHPFFGYIQQLYRDGITSGCAQNPLRFCPDAVLTRDQAAVMLLRIQNGGSYQPPSATGGIFADVPTNTKFADFIEEFYRNAMTVGCANTPLQFCPSQPTTRAAMAVFLDRLFELH